MIEFSNMSFGYSSHKNVLEDINIHLGPGNIYGLLGKNGVGKSTLFRLITGANPIKTGTARTFGANPFDRIPDVMARIFLIPEEIHFPSLTLQQYGGLYGEFYPKFTESRMMEIAKEFEVPIENQLNMMSQGQRKKAYMSFALACDTDLLLMDEPTNGLDIPGKTSFRRILSDMRSPERLIIISTHQVRDLERLIDAVMILDKSHVALCATAKELFQLFHFGDVTDDAKAIYVDETVRGKVGLSLRQPDQPVQDIDQLDLETLFNAAMVNRDGLASALAHAGE